MKTVAGLALASMVALILSGCTGSDGEAEGCDTQLNYISSTNGSGSNSSIKLTNNSDYTIDSVYSGVNGNIAVSSVFIPTDSGEYFIANSSGGCDRGEILKIVDEFGCSQSVQFYRACGETAEFEVVNSQ